MKASSFLLGLILGVLIGTPVWLRRSEWLFWDQLNLSNLLSVASIVINVILATIVVSVLTRLQDIRRVEKNILISRVDTEINAIKKFVAECYEKESVDFSTITSFLKTTKIRLNKITDTHSNCKTESNDLLENITTLNGLLTDPKGTEDIIIDQNKVTLKPRRIQEIDIQLAEIENKALDLVICVNRQSLK